MKCGPPEQAVIPSIAHSGGKVKGGGRARPRRLGLPDPYGPARAGDILGARRGAGDMPCPACLRCVTAGRHDGDGSATGQEDMLPVPPADGIAPSWRQWPTAVPLAADSVGSCPAWSGSVRAGKGSTGGGSPSRVYLMRIPSACGPARARRRPVSCGWRRAWSRGADRGS